MKQLEWVKHPTADLWRAECILGRYQAYAVISQTSWAFDAFDGITKASGDAADADEAKAAAQADYTARILSALASPAPVKAEAEVVAWRWKDWWPKDEPFESKHWNYSPDPPTEDAVGCLYEPLYATPSSGGRREALEEAAKVADVLAAENAGDWATEESAAIHDTACEIARRVRAIANTNPTGAE